MNAVNIEEPYKKTLGELLAGSDLSSIWASVRISSVVLDSREVKPGSLFFAINGKKTQGEKFVRDAIEAGASAIIIQTEERSIVFKRLRKEFPEIPLLCDCDLPQNISLIASRFYNHPSLNLCCVGITGTNGKSSCVHLVSEIWRLLGRQSASIGTLGYGLHSQGESTGGVELPVSQNSVSSNKLISTGMTTPDAVSTQRILSEMREQNVTHLAMEVSSHGIDQGRVSGVSFNVRGLTNVTRDHLDYHKNFGEYARVKSSFVTPSENSTAVINIDDEVGSKAVKTWKSKKNLIQYSLSDYHADIYAPQRDFNNHGITARIVSPWGSGILRTRLLGDFNLSNLLACIAVCCSAGENFQKVLKCIAKLYPAPGRMQRVLLQDDPATDISNTLTKNSNNERIKNVTSKLLDFPESRINFNDESGQSDIAKRVYIDFAHTPDALEKAIVALRQHTDKKLWVVFGCGGDRDVGKRYIMGELAAQLCDYVIMTSDNPRSEEPKAIIQQISAGAHAATSLNDSRSSDNSGSPARSVSAASGIDFRERLLEIEDREAAIAYAINSSSAGDTVLIAGKGHEEFQIIKDKKIPFSDYHTASKYLKGATAKDSADSCGGDYAPE